MIKYNSVREITDLKDMLYQSERMYKDNIAFKLKKNSERVNITYKEFAKEVNSLGTKLISLGLKNKKIAIISENRYEWCVAYLATVCGTGIVVPLDKLLTKTEIENLIIRSEVECIFYSNKYAEIIEEIRKKEGTKLKIYVSMDNEKNSENVYSEMELIKEGEKLLENGNTEFLNAKINKDEMNFMLFTSGTTNASKAVMLSHTNIASNIMGMDR